MKSVVDAFARLGIAIYVLKSAEVPSAQLPDLDATRGGLVVILVQFLTLGVRIASAHQNDRDIGAFSGHLNNPLAGKALKRVLGGKVGPEAEQEDIGSVIAQFAESRVVFLACHVP